MHKSIQIGSTALLISIFTQTPLLAQLSLPEKAPVIAKSWDWSIYRAVIPLLNLANCTGIYKDKLNIQLFDKALFVAAPVPDFVRWRLDDGSVKSRVPSSIEKRFQVIGFMGSEFDQILLAKRLKVEVFNIRSRVVDQDINLTGFREAYGVLQTAQCR